MDTADQWSRQAKDEARSQTRDQLAMIAKMDRS